MKSRGRGRDDSGFTLIELVVSLVILPLIIGAAAVVLIVSAKNTNQAKNRLSDSSNAQLTAAYFVRDVQGATQITTDATPPTGPSVCGTIWPDPATTPKKLLAALYRSASTLDVAYWEVTTTLNGATVYEIERLSCGATSSHEVLVDDADPTAQGLASITGTVSNPATEWVQTAAITTNPTAVALSGSNDTIPLANTTAFAKPTGAVHQTLSFYADVNPGTGPFVLETVTCTAGNTATSPGSYSSCSGGSGTIDAGTTISQPLAITSVQLTVAETGTQYTVGLRGSPRVLTFSSSGNGIQIPGVPPSNGGSSTGGSGSNGGGPQNGGPSLLTLVSGVSLTGGHNSSLNVTGQLDVSGGTLSCTGGPTATATGYQAVGGSSAIGSCAQNASTTTTKLPNPTQDPLASFLPYPVQSWASALTCYGNNSPAYSTGSCQSLPNGTCQPGEYTQALPTGCNLEPGVYILDEGYSANGGTLQMAGNAASGQGVLLYLPCTASYCSGSISMGGNAALGLPPLSASQASALFGSTTPASPTGMQNVLIWQDAGNTTPDSLGGTSGNSTSTGTIYVPQAPLTLQGNAAGTYGQIIAASVSITGSTPMTVTGQ